MHTIYSNRSRIYVTILLLSLLSLYLHFPCFPNYILLFSFVPKLTLVIYNLDSHYSFILIGSGFSGRRPSAFPVRLRAALIRELKHARF